MRVCVCYPRVCCSQEQRSGLGSADLEGKHTRLEHAQQQINMENKGKKVKLSALEKSNYKQDECVHRRGDYMATRAREAGGNGKGVAFTVKRMMRCFSATCLAFYNTAPSPSGPSGIHCDLMADDTNS